MIPNPRLFRSRWSAIIWSAGIVWFAIDVASSAPRSATPPTVNAAAPSPQAEDAPDARDLAVLANVIDG